MSAILKIDFLICLTNALSQGLKLHYADMTSNMATIVVNLRNYVRVCMCLFIWAGIACQNYLKFVLTIKLSCCSDLFKCRRLTVNMAIILKIYF